LNERIDRVIRADDQLAAQWHIESSPNRTFALAIFCSLLFFNDPLVLII
jgi:hypothetical protein